jgi:hypothetical protein
VLIDLGPEDYHEYYNGYANKVLWPILHYRLDLAEFSRRDLSGYMRVNQRFAAELKRLLQPEDIIWVHDYHLMPLAKELRNSGHRNRIGFFHHVPFPPPEFVTALPNHERHKFRTLSAEGMRNAEPRSIHISDGRPDDHDRNFSGWCRDNATLSARTTCRPLAVRAERGGELGRSGYDNWG